MRVVVQRASQAQVNVNGVPNGSIGHGLVVLVGIEDADTEADAEWLAAKLVRLRIFNDDEGKMNASVLDVAGGMLVVSQFTRTPRPKKARGLRSSERPTPTTPSRSTSTSSRRVRANSVETSRPGSLAPTCKLN